MDKEKILSQNKKRIYILMNTKNILNFKNLFFNVCFIYLHFNSFH